MEGGVDKLSNVTRLKSSGKIKICIIVHSVFLKQARNELTFRKTAICTLKSFTGLRTV